MVKRKVSVSEGHGRPVRTLTCGTGVRDSTSTPVTGFAKGLPGSPGPRGSPASAALPPDSMLRASSEVCPPARAAFLEAGLPRGAQAAELVTGSHWSSFLGGWKSRRHPVQP